MSDSRCEGQEEGALTQMLLLWMEATPADRAVIEEEIRTAFEETRAIFVLDMSEFSSSVIKRGILHFLARIHEMRSVVRPVVEKHGGEIVKFIGDDVVAIFDDVDEALAASREIRTWTQVNPPTPDREGGFRVAIGIGYGPLLHVPRYDIWGNEVNLAFKLGEDTASADEILLTENAHDQLRDSGEEFQRLDINVSGITFVAYQDLLTG